MPEQERTSIYAPHEPEEPADTIPGAPDKVSRRRFLKQAAVGGVTLAGATEIAKVVVSSVPDNSSQELYDKEVHAGDRIMTQWEYVVMSDREKEEMVQVLMDSYHTKA